MMTRQPTWRHPLWVLLTLSALTLGFAACDDSGGSEVPNDMGDDLADAPSTDVVDPMTSLLVQVTPPPGEAQRMNFNGDTTVGVRFVTSDMTGIANQTLVFIQLIIQKKRVVPLESCHPILLLLCPD